MLAMRFHDTAMQFHDTAMRFHDSAAGDDDDHEAVLVNLPPLVLGRTFPPLRVILVPWMRGSDESALRRLTRLATSSDPPHTAPQTLS